MPCADDDDRQRAATASIANRRRMTQALVLRPRMTYKKLYDEKKMVPGDPSTW